MYAGETTNNNTIFKVFCLGDQRGQREFSTFCSRPFPKYPIVRIYSAVTITGLWLLYKKECVGGGMQKNMKQVRAALSKLLVNCNGLEGMGLAAQCLGSGRCRSHGGTRGSQGFGQSEWGAHLKCTS